jgi:hypothetical protein
MSDSSTTDLPNPLKSNISTTAAVSGETGNHRHVQPDLNLFVPPWLRDFLPSLKGAALSIYLSYASRADKESHAGPSVALLCKESGYGERAVRSARALLIGMGLLHPVNQTRQGGRFDTQIFKIILNKPEENLCGSAATVLHLPPGGESGAALQTTTTYFPSECSPEESLQNPLFLGGERGAVGERDPLGVRDAAGNVTNACRSSSKGERGYGGKRGILPAQKRENSIRQAYEEDVSEQNFFDFLQTSDSATREDRIKNWHRYRKHFPEFNKDATHVSWSFGCLLVDKFEEYATRLWSGSLKRSFFCCKVIDAAVAEGVRYDPDFQEMRCLLRRKDTSE